MTVRGRQEHHSLPIDLGMARTFRLATMGAAWWIRISIGAALLFRYRELLERDLD